MENINKKLSSFFKNLNDSELNAIYEYSSIVYLEKKDVLFKENYPGDSFYIIINGEIGIYKNNNSLKMTELVKLNQGQFFGEMALIDDRPRSATVIAKTNSKLLKIKKNDFIDLCSKYPNVLMQLTKIMSSRIREDNIKFIEIWNSLITKNKLEAVGFATNKIIHDIRTPLSIIVISAQMMLNINNNTNKLSKRIIEQTKIIDEMVREILDFSKENITKFTYSEINPDLFLSEITLNLKELLQKNNIVFQYQITSKKNFLGDRIKLKRVITNIVKNAIEAINNKGEIYLDYSADEKYCYFCIKDSGKGIPNEIIKTIFEPFITKNKPNGTGLGLAIVKKIITDHNGEITAKNSEKSGAIFEITLPLKNLK